MLFTGNTDDSGTQTIHLSHFILCRFLRFAPKTWGPGGIAFRENTRITTAAASSFTLLHQTASQVTQSQLQLVSVGRALPDASYTTSSSKDEAHSAHFANLGKIVQDGTTHYWQPATDEAGQYVQVDFTQPLELGGLMTKGGDTGWLTSFQLKYSTDGEQWTTYDQ
ncbi:discoidin domain-containing protein, partial [Klebsiella pneumoniae]